MAFLGVRIQDEFYTKVKNRAKLSGVSVTEYVLSLLAHDLEDSTFEIDDSWLINGSYLFGLSVAQIKHAISNSYTAAAALAQISSKSKKLDLIVDNADPKDLFVTVEIRDDVISVIANKLQNKSYVVMEVMKKLDEKLTEV